MAAWDYYPYTERCSLLAGRYLRRRTQAQLDVGWSVQASAETAVADPASAWSRLYREGAYNAYRKGGVPGVDLFSICIVNDVRQQAGWSAGFANYLSGKIAINSLLAIGDAKAAIEAEKQRPRFGGMTLDLGLKKKPPRRFGGMTLDLGLKPSGVTIPIPITFPDEEPFVGGACPPGYVSSPQGCVLVEDEDQDLKLLMDQCAAQGGTFDPQRGCVLAEKKESKALLYGGIALAVIAVAGIGYYAMR